MLCFGKVTTNNYVIQVLHVPIYCTGNYTKLVYVIIIDKKVLANKIAF